MLGIVVDQRLGLGAIGRQALGQYLRRVVDPTGNAVAILLLLVPWVTFALAAVVLRRSGGMSAAMGQS